MKKQITIILFLFFTIFQSCTNKTKTLYLKIDSADGILTEADITLKGISIGIVKDVSLDQNNEVLITIEYDKKINLPIDSKFIIMNVDIMGTKSVYIEKGKQEQIVADKDTLVAFHEKASSSFDIDAIENKLFNKILGNDKQDSILIELRRLNENLEKQEKEN